MSLTKLSLAGNYLIIPGQGEFGKLHPGWGREKRKPFFNLFYSVGWTWGSLRMKPLVYLYPAGERG
jgi:hypothetical protein